MSCQREKSLLLPTHFYPLYAIISILRLLFRNISHVIILTKREQENENERWRNLGDYQCSLIFLLLHVKHLMNVLVFKI